MDFKQIPVGDEITEAVNVIIEIPKHTGPVKYEIDKDTGALMVDRFLNTAMYYPCNYGYIPQTLAEDGDPVDVLVVTPDQLISGSVIEARPVGVLQMSDEKGEDAKILAVPSSELTEQYSDVKEPSDLSTQLLNMIEHFFEHYKDLESNKWVRIEGWQGPKPAVEEIQASIKRYQQTSE